SNFIPVVVVKDLSSQQAMFLEENRFRLQGILIKMRLQRNYPYTDIASHILGYLGEIDPWRLEKLTSYGYTYKDLVGFGGVEEKYDFFLRQQTGGTIFQVDRKNRIVRIIGFKPPRNGKDIQLTIDIRIQKIVEEKLSGKKGAVIIMDPYTGEIIAMASAPVFSPDAFLKKDLRLKNYFNDPSAPLLNRAIAGLYPLGSVFKLVVATAGLKLKKINLQTRFFCQGRIKIGEREFGCWDTHGNQDLISAIIQSCNIFFYKTGLLVGPENIYKWALKFGFGQPTQIDLPYEEKGFLPSVFWDKLKRKRRWSEGDTANLSIGQGELLVTPLQVARMMAVFANGGNLVKPYIVKAIDGKDITNYQRRSTNLDIEDEIFQVIRKGLRGVVADPEGTASFLSKLDVSIAGKTGTVQVPEKKPHGWFVGFFPYEKPKYVICVILENVGAGYYSAELAGEIIKEMLEEKLL
ncbi:MAG: penicillin-binding protein 2, partial [Candidatus Omnitrophica bacterium]|nr:penicillin-binding protein 2 [Candidatus Omnitrophota bacterium]